MKCLRWFELSYTFRSEKAMALHSSTHLENPMDGGAWWAAVHGAARSWAWLNDWITTANRPKTWRSHVRKGCNSRPCCEVVIVRITITVNINIIIYQVLEWVFCTWCLIQSLNNTVRPMLLFPFYRWGKSKPRSSNIIWWNADTNLNS